MTDDVCPLADVDRLWEWSRETDKSLLNRAQRPPPIRHVAARMANGCGGGGKNDGRPLVLLCHDMQGGYLPFERNEGCDVQPGDGTQPFPFVHWWHIDVFCYFSHNLVTIPPHGWTRAAHLHGVRVLGTLITEWDDGARKMERILHDDHSINRTVRQLTEIAIAHRFEGWLVNVEHAVAPTKVPALMTLVRRLRDAMWAVNDQALVVWYDSVTVQGQLKWQNALNNLNEDWLLVSDAVYLNYGWTEHKELAGSGDRVDRLGRPRAHVMAGIDVFGRGCPGGWNCDVPLAAARRHGLSVAIFAPGWLVETRPGEDPVLDSIRFWRPLLSNASRRPIRELPLSTDFSSGFSRRGRHFQLNRAQLAPLFDVCGSIQLNQTEPGVLLQPVDRITLFTVDLPKIVRASIRLRLESRDLIQYISPHLTDCTDWTEVEEGSAGSPLFRCDQRAAYSLSEIAFRVQEQPIRVLWIEVVELPITSSG